MTQWHYQKGEETFGPIPEEQFRAMLADERVLPSDLVWHEGMPQRRPAGEVSELSIFLPNMPATTPSSHPRKRRARPHRGGTVLTLGVVGLVLCWICGIIAWVMGSRDLREMRRGRMDKSGYGMTQAGLVCGAIGTVLGILAMLLWVFVIAD
jgi:hypothetical protein